MQQLDARSYGTVGSRSTVSLRYFVISHTVGHQRIFVGSALPRGRVGGYERISGVEQVGSRLR